VDKIRDICAGPANILEDDMHSAIIEKSKVTKKDKSPAKSVAGAIHVWEDDPGTGVKVAITARPDPGATPLPFGFPAPAPEPSDDTSSFAFRYWTAASALRRGADFWAPKVPTGKWESDVGPVLPVIFDDAQHEELNAFYDRKALNFFHGPSPDGVVFSGASPDVTCHEMGHAILDSLKPELFDVGSQEAAAFHESFGDMSAILSDLQQPSLRAAILQDTGGHIARNSRLSRLAEQLGAAIRAQDPDAVDPDCLRNAANSFSYADPSTLPSSAPASQLSSEPHSFSRLFTGAFLDALGAMLTAHAADPAKPTPDELRDVSLQMRDILVAAIINAPVVSNFMSQVAAGMVTASAAADASYPEIFKQTFTRRAIISLQTSAAATEQRVAAAAIRGAAAPPLSSIPLGRVPLPAAHYGLDQPVIVSTPSHPRFILASAAATDLTPVEPASAVTAATQFLDDLFARGKVDVSEVTSQPAMVARSRRLKTHKVARENGAFTLKRILFDCGICQR
jgi:hypothetical protein